MTTTSKHTPDTCSACASLREQVQDALHMNPDAEKVRLSADTWGTPHWAQAKK